MNPIRSLLAVLFLLASAAPGAVAKERPGPDQVLHNWYRMVLELVRHTPTYSPPVASRAFAYLGVTAYEASASGAGLASLAGQLNGLAPVPARDADAIYDEAVVMQAAMAFGVRNFFGNTGPTGQRAMKAMEAQLSQITTAGLREDVAARSMAFGEAVGAHILHWSKEDGGAVVENMGFPFNHTPSKGPGAWAPTSLVAQQQAPLLPEWGDNRTFAMPTGASCPLPPPPAYSEEAGSDFHAEAMEVYETSEDLTPEQTAIARFWSDDPMLSPTPPGHWISIAMEILQERGADSAERVDLLARLGIAMADAFIGCWHAKYEFDLIRPVTYIRRLIEPEWQPILITPPFPEYPSGHSTQSGAAAAVLTAHFGEGFAFEDATHVDEGLGVRSYADFEAAAEEAAMSRLYGGIHFRAAIERGLEQGYCIGAHATALKTVN
ncbi:MAG: vanadium-dependent haloperoxidase [Aliihoeflea sp.]